MSRATPAWRSDGRWNLSEHAAGIARRSPWGASGTWVIRTGVHFQYGHARLRRDSGMLTRSHTGTGPTVVGPVPGLVVSIREHDGSPTERLTDWLTLDRTEP